MTEKTKKTEQIEKALEQTEQIEKPTELNAEDLEKVAGGKIYNQPRSNTHSF